MIFNKVRGKSQKAATDSGIRLINYKSECLQSKLLSYYVICEPVLSEVEGSVATVRARVRVFKNARIVADVSES